MKTTRILLLTLLVLLAGRDVASAADPSIGVGLQIGPSGGATVDLGFFYDDLAPYGYWVDRPGLPTPSSWLTGGAVGALPVELAGFSPGQLRPISSMD